MPSIRDFSGGVLNQELQNRDNGNGILFDCKNVLSSWNGELRKRTGTRLLKELEGNSKLIPYRLPDGDDMIMVLRNNIINCYVFDKSGNLLPYITDYESEQVTFPTTGWSSNTNGDWTVSANGLTQDAFYAIEPRSSGYSLDSVYNKSMVYVFENQNPVILRSFDLRWVYNIGRATDQPGTIYADSPVIQYSDDGIVWRSIETEQDNKNQVYQRVGPTLHKGYKTTTTYSVKNNSFLTAHKFWRVTFKDVTVFGYPYSGSSRSWTFSVENIKFIDTTAEELVFNNCPYTNEDFDAIKWSQNNRTLTMTCKGKIPYQIDVEEGAFVDRTFTPSDYTDIWEDAGYPACVTYYQNRLWFGGFEQYPSRVYSSEFGKFDKFQIPNSIVATSPIMADGTEISGIIENMWGGNSALYCLSEDGVSMIDAQGAIVATDHVEFKLRNREPVNSMIPTVKDDIMIYLGRDKRKILVTDYDFVVQRFRANCISDNYNNFLQAGIKELHYIPRKSSLIYGILEDGKWFAQLFSTDKSKNALYPFETTGNVIDIQPIKKGDETKLIMLTRLSSYQYIIEEKIAQPDQEIMDFMTKQEKENYTEKVLNSEKCYLDHSITRHTESPVETVGNLPYLSGDMIDVIADGNYLGKKEVLQRNSNTLFGWKRTDGSGRQEIVYTDEQNPIVGSIVYDENYSDKTDYAIESITEVAGTVLSLIVKQPSDVYFYAYKYVEDGVESVVYALPPVISLELVDAEGNIIGNAESRSESSLIYQGNTYIRDTSLDRTITISVNVHYDKYQDNEISVWPSYVDLDEPVTDVVLGYTYDSYAVLKFVSPYNMRKFPKEIAVNFINTGYLEVGNTFDSLKSVLNNLVESVTIDNKKILMNGNYTKTLDKQTFETPYVIVRSDKGLPFIITGIDYKVDMSNYQGGV